MPIFYSLTKALFEGSRGPPGHPVFTFFTSNSARKSIKNFDQKLTLVTLVTLVTKVLTLPFLGDVQSPCSLYNPGTLSPAAPKKKGPRILVPYITRVLCPRPLRDFCLKLSLFLGLAPAPLLLFYIYPGGLSPAAPRIFDK